MECPITLCELEDPVTAADGVTYERRAIAEWMARGNLTSPMTGAPLAHKEVVANRALACVMKVLAVD